MADRYEAALHCTECAQFLMPHDTEGHDRWHAALCTGCHLPVNMGLSGGVRDKDGKPFHDACLNMAREKNGYAR